MKCITIGRPTYDSAKTRHRTSMLREPSPPMHLPCPKRGVVISHDHICFLVDISCILSCRATPKASRSTPLKKNSLALWEVHIHQLCRLHHKMFQVPLGTYICTNRRTNYRSKAHTIFYKHWEAKSEMREVNQTEVNM